jgi:hypothetical protein
MNEKHKYKRKPRKCPECKSNRIASIRYGMHPYSEKLEDDIKQGKIVLGGCCDDDNDPKWQCTDCGLELHKDFMDSEDILFQYLDKFGHTLNFVNYPESIIKKVYREMQKALDNKRGPLSDDEFGQSIPDGCYS